MTMFSSSLVDENRIKQDPRRLAFLFPKLPLSRYKELTDEWYRAHALKAVEDAARINGQLLVPSVCLNKKRRDPQRRLYLFGRTYYMIYPTELTAVELAKYREYTGGGGGEHEEPPALCADDSR